MDNKERSVESSKPTSVGYLESNVNRKSSTRLNVIICACICVMAAGVEGAGKLVSIVRSDEVIVQANWQAITYMVGVLLLGNGVIKAAQGVKGLMYKSKN